MSKRTRAKGQKLRVLVIAGSNRRQLNSPGIDSKARALALRLRARLPADWEVDWEDLGNVYARARIQSCNSCVSTSKALCCWPCNCFEKNNHQEPDLMWNLDLYARLEKADAWAIIGPVQWYGPTSNLKLMFDRLVCMNGGNPDSDKIEHKNPELAMRLEHTAEWSSLSVNHLEGRTAAFYTYGDGGGDELGPDGRPRLLCEKNIFDPAHEPNPRQAYAPLVWQCRYSGIEVPDDLWAYCEFGQGQKNSDNQAEHLMLKPEVFIHFDHWVEGFAQFVRRKGKAPAAQHSAINYKPPVHQWEDLKLKWREVRVRVGKAPRGSSPRLQHDLGLNQD